MLHWPRRMCLALVLIQSFSLAAFAARPADQLLPQTTKGYISAPNFAELGQAWHKTQLGQLMEDPIMKPFADDMKKKLQEHWSKSHQQLGITWDDLDGIPQGEIAMALVQPSEKEAATILLVNITGHEAETRALLDRLGQKLTAKKAKKSTRLAYGENVVIYDIPKSEDQPAAQGCYVIKDGMLLVGDHLGTVENMIARINQNDPKECLAKNAAYQKVTERCQQAAGELQPHLKWFLEPFGYTEAVRLSHPAHHRRKGLDLVKILKNQGFDCVQGLGGYVNFATDRHEMLHRTAIYAPPVKGSAERYTLAARLLSFPNSTELQSQPWVPKDLVGYITFNWEIEKAFNSVGGLVDEVVGDHVWEDILDSMKTDPNGPQIDLRTDLVELLDHRCTVLSDHILPITPKSERLCLVVGTNNAERLAMTVEKAMKTDETAHRREIDGHIIYEIVAEETQAPPMVTLEGTATEPQEEEAKLPNSAVTVHNNHLFVATHIDFLLKVLEQRSEQETLAQSNDYQQVRQEMERLSGNDHCLEAFSRTDEEYRAVYELIRTDKMPEAETMLARLLNFMLGEGKKGVLRQQQIDGHNLPDFEQVRRYFGPAGLSMVSEEDGWFITGFALGKQSDVPEVAERPGR